MRKILKLKSLDIYEPQNNKLGLLSISLPKAILTFLLFIVLPPLGIIALVYILFLLSSLIMPMSW